MQKCNFDFSLLEFKIQIKTQQQDLITFLIICNRFVVGKPYNINSWTQLLDTIYIYIYIEKKNVYIYIYKGASSSPVWELRALDPL